MFKIKPTHRPFGGFTYSLGGGGSLQKMLKFLSSNYPSLYCELYEYLDEKTKSLLDNPRILHNLFPIDDNVDKSTTIDDAKFYGKLDSENLGYIHYMLDVVTSLWEPPVQVYSKKGHGIYITHMDY